PVVPLVVPAGGRSLRDVVRVKGPYAQAVSRVLGNALIVKSFDAARAIARTVSVPVATMNGEVFRGPLQIEGGWQRDAHGILGMRGEIDRLREQVAMGRADVARMTDESSSLQAAIDHSDNELAR